MVTTREGSPSDVASMAGLWTAANVARRAEIGLPLGPVAGAGEAEAREQVSRRLADPAGFAVLAEEDGEPVAMALFLQALEQDGLGPPVPGLAHVSMVAVRPDRWGAGLGAVVLRAALRSARNRGFTHAQLWTHETNLRGQRLYERLGWTASGRTKGDDHGERIRHFVLELRPPEPAQPASS
jgi:GNAT superfamily N-acetyltransferase